jgi:hemoglobin-like flavoprotein
MNQEIVRQVQESFKGLVPMADQVGVLFYSRLFETHPDLRPMFAQDIQPQAKKLVQMLALVVSGLHRLDALMPAVRDLARRHSRYGVVEAHYAVVGETLTWTLEQGLGDAFTPAVRHAWSTAYGTLSAAMISAAEESPIAA